MIERPPFESLFAPLLSPAYDRARRLMHNAADADDLVQEAALQAHRAYHTFEPGTQFRAWFFRILINCFFSRCRRTRKERDAVPLDDAPEFDLYGRTAEGGIHWLEANPAQALLAKLDQEQVAAALAELPPDYRAVATLYFIEDFSYAQIAEAVGCPIGTVRSRLHRARKMLRRELRLVAVDQGLVPKPAARRAS